ncbi:MAG TPA: OmpA family protein, partial [Spirochaetota bacterium]|nr:OmpA family protein [Spirochaetota bacterium]
GHTDNRPYEGEQFKDNWDLSAQRAWAILDVIRDIPSLTSFDESRISIAGYGDTVPVAGNDTPEKRALNRRVEIVLLRDDI